VKVLLIICLHRTDENNIEFYMANNSIVIDTDITVKETDY